MKEIGKIIKVSGPLIVAGGMSNCKMYDVVRVSKSKLIGEIIELRGDKASIQVYEETGGIGPGEEVYSTNMPLSVELGPGLIESIFDGIQRPLTALREISGDRIARGIDVRSLNHEKKWKFNPTAKIGDKLIAGDEVGYVQENDIIRHKIMVPYKVEGELIEIYDGEYTIDETIGKLKNSKGEIVDLIMLQKCSVRKGRPYTKKLPPELPMITGQRVIDTFFPIAKGGVAAVPGPFGQEKQLFSINSQSGQIQK